MPRSDGSCLNDALTQLLGFDPGLPDWVMTDENPAIARRFGLRFFGERGAIELDESEPAVFVVPTIGNRAHVYYVPAGQIGEFLDRNRQPILCIFMR